MKSKPSKPAKNKTSIIKNSSKHSKEEDTSKTKPFRYLSFMDKTSISFFKDWIKINKQKSTTFLVFMKLRNGKNSIFLASTNNGTFLYRGGRYMIDTDFMTEELHTGLSLLYYHQDCTTPFKITFNISELSEKLSNSGFDNVEKAINPQTLKGFINSQVIEKVLKGEELSNELSMMKKLMIITLIISIVSATLNAKAMGLF